MRRSKRLEEACRVFALRMEGHSIAEIAKMFGRSTAWVQKRIEYYERAYLSEPESDDFTRAVLIERIESLVRDVLPLSRKDVKWADFVLKATISIAKMRGVDEPPQQTDEAKAVIRAIAAHLKAFDPALYYEKRYDLESPPSALEPPVDVEYEEVRPNVGDPSKASTDP